MVLWSAIKPDANAVSQTVVIEKTEILTQWLNNAPSPYIHDAIANNTGKKIVDFEQGMLGYDKDGNPLEGSYFYKPL